MIEPLRLVIDPNVYVAAALKPDGTCGQLVEALDDDLVAAVVCPHLLDELHDVLSRPELRRWITPDGASAYWHAIRARSEVDNDPTDVPAYTRDAADDYLIALALENRVEAIVSGDLDLRTADLPVPVWSPREALDRVAANTSRE